MKALQRKLDGMNKERFRAGKTIPTGRFRESKTVLDELRQKESLWESRQQLLDQQMREEELQSDKEEEDGLNEEFLKIPRFVPGVHDSSPPPEREFYEETEFDKINPPERSHLTEGSERQRPGGYSFVNRQVDSSVRTQGMNSFAATYNSLPHETSRQPFQSEQYSPDPAKSFLAPSSIHPPRHSISMGSQGISPSSYFPGGILLPCRNLTECLSFMKLCPQLY